MANVSDAPLITLDMQQMCFQQINYSRSVWFDIVVKQQMVQEGVAVQTVATHFLFLYFFNMVIHVYWQDWKSFAQITIFTKSLLLVEINIWQKMAHFQNQILNF